MLSWALLLEVHRSFVCEDLLPCDRVVVSNLGGLCTSSLVHVVYTGVVPVACRCLGRPYHTCDFVVAAATIHILLPCGRIIVNLVVYCHDNCSTCSKVAKQKVRNRKGVRSNRCPRNFTVSNSGEKFALSCWPNFSHTSHRWITSLVVFQKAISDAGSRRQLHLISTTDAWCCTVRKTVFTWVGHLCREDEYLFPLYLLFLYRVPQIPLSPLLLANVVPFSALQQRTQFCCPCLTEFAFQQTCCGGCVGQCVVWKRMTAIPLLFRHLDACHPGLLAVPLGQVQDWVGQRY